MPPTLAFSGSYLGGHPARDRPEKSATLVINDEGIEVSVFRKFIDEPWENITGLSAEGPDQVQTRFTATRFLLMGPLALAFKKEKKTACFIVVDGGFGEFIFLVRKKSPNELRAAFAPWMSRLKSEDRLTSESPAEMQLRGEHERLELLKDLAELRAQGALSEEEFEAEKQRILSW